MEVVLTKIAKSKMELSDYFRLAQICSASELYDKSAKYIIEGLESHKILTVEEFNQAVSFLRQHTGTLRAAIRSVAITIENKSIGSQYIEGMEVYLEKLVNELKSTCNEFINLIKTHTSSIPFNEGLNLVVKKTIEDFRRYCIEFDKDVSTDILDDIERNYEELLHSASSDNNLLEIYTDIALCYSVFLYEVRKEPETALDLARMTEKNVRSLFVPTKKNQQTNTFEMYYKLIKANISLWESST